MARWKHVYGEFAWEKDYTTMIEPAVELKVPDGETFVWNKVYERHIIKMSDSGVWGVWQDAVVYDSTDDPWLEKVQFDSQESLTGDNGEYADYYYDPSRYFYAEEYEQVSFTLTPDNHQHSGQDLYWKITLSGVTYASGVETNTNIPFSGSFSAPYATYPGSFTAPAASRNGGEKAYTMRIKMAPNPITSMWPNGNGQVERYRFISTSN